MFNARVRFLLSCKYYSILFHLTKICHSGHSGTGHDDTGKPNDGDSKCGPGVCFKRDMCKETADGVECAPCPDGYTGDGIQCDDIDEVRLHNAFFNCYIDISAAQFI